MSLYAVAAAFLMDSACSENTTSTPPSCCSSSPPDIMLSPIIFPIPSAASLCPRFVKKFPISSVERLDCSSRSSSLPITSPMASLNFRSFAEMTMFSSSTVMAFLLPVMLIVDGCYPRHRRLRALPCRSIVLHERTEMPLRGLRKTPRSIRSKPRQVRRMPGEHRAAPGFISAALHGGAVQVAELRRGEVVELLRISAAVYCYFS